MLAVLLALTSAVSFGGSDYTAGLAARKAGVLRVTLAAEIVNAVVVIGVVPFVSSKQLSVLPLAWGAAAGVGGVTGAMALYLGFRYAAFSVAGTVSGVAAAAFSVLAGLLFGERPSALSLAGIALTVPAIVMVSASSGVPDADLANENNVVTATTGQDDVSRAHPTSGAQGRHLAGVAFGLAAGAGFGVFLIGLNRAGSNAGLWPIGAADLAAVITAACIASVAGQLALPQTGTRGLCLLTGIIAALGTITYFLATHRGLLAVTAVIYSLYPAWTIVLARVLSGERLTAIRIVGLCLAAASIGLIVVGNVGLDDQTAGAPVHNDGPDLKPRLFAHDRLRSGSQAAA
jgi:drug/metabolite transporter (DMT)-like permease